MVAWLLSEPDGDRVRRALTQADRVLTSDLTLVECDRALIRAQTALDLGEEEMVRRQSLLGAAVVHWTLMRISQPIVARARRPFPGEPIRTLDALHLASALAAADSFEDVTVLSLDRRVRGSARALGLAVAPA